MDKGKMYVPTNAPLLPNLYLKEWFIFLIINARQKIWLLFVPAVSVINRGDIFGEIKN